VRNPFAGTVSFFEPDSSTAWIEADEAVVVEVGEE
jgi:hypothetical protein